MSEKQIIWCDVESTGLEEDDHFLLEVAVRVTDLDLNLLDPDGFSSPVYYPASVVPSLFAKANEYVQNMHTSTGLWERLPEGMLLTELDEKLIAFIKLYNPEPGTAWLGGNSIFLDRSFLKKYLPLTFAHIHYRSVDVTSWAGPMQWWLQKKYTKKATHNAFADIMESIQEMRLFREVVLAGAKALEAAKK